MNSLHRLGALAFLALAVACGAAATPSADPAAGGTAVTPSAAPATGGAAVTYKSFQIDPKSIEVKTGQVVTWTNGDSAAHTITAGTPGTKSGAFDQKLAGNSTAKVTFDKAGTFDYFCELHTTMVGKVIVK